MENWQKNLLILWIGSLVTSASYSMVIPFLPLFLLQIGVKHHTEMWSGLLFSAAFLAGAVASPFWGAVADKYGRKPMIIRAGIALGLIYFLTAFVTNPYELLILRVMQGLLSGYIPGAIALVGTSTPENKIGYALAMISTATSSGGIIGPLLGGGISKLLDNRMAFGSAGVLVFLSTLLVIFFVKEEGFVPSKGKSTVFGAIGVAAQNRTFMFVMLLTILTSFSVMTIEPVLPLYIVQIGGSVNNASLLAGIVFSLAGIASVLFAPQWGKLSSKVGFRYVLMIGLLGGGLGNLAQILFHNIWGFSIVRFMFGAFFCAVFPALNGLVVRSTQSDFRGRAFSLNQTANQLGTMFGPIVGGAVGGAYTIHSVFWVTGLLLLLTMGFTYWVDKISPLEKSVAEE
ncbi:MFS transporter [Alicyclobacillus fodiniaquatilis]|jgi:MFS family permease|uniref:MFS transporter n=1 Tax=Alicyclobacillus fodiniaquatilis TaxID=1661150 RepID=A0ABW4JL37_9BACL